MSASRRHCRAKVTTRWFSGRLFVLVAPPSEILFSDPGDPSAFRAMGSVTWEEVERAVRAPTAAQVRTHERVLSQQETE